MLLNVKLSFLAVFAFLSCWTSSFRSSFQVALRKRHLVLNSQDRSDLWSSNSPKQSPLPLFQSNSQSDQKLSIIADSLYDKLLISDGKSFDSQEACKEHLQLLYTLICSDVQNVDAEENSMTMQAMNEEKKPFPQSYSTALDFLHKMLQKIKSTSHPVHGAAKFITKKEGISSNTHIGEIMTIREIVDTKRKIERALSLLLVLLIAYKCSQVRGPDTTADLLYFSKVLLERVPVHERHFSLILLCRGIVAPPCASLQSMQKPTPESADEGFFAEKLPKNEEENMRVDSMQSSLSSPSYSRAFVEGMRKAGIEQPSSTARLLFPFVSFAVRHLRMSKNLHGKPMSRRDDLFDDEDAFDSDADLNSYDADSADDDQLCQMMQACMLLDQQIEKSNGLSGAADDVLHSLRRWVADFSALHLINEHETASTSGASLPPPRPPQPPQPPPSSPKAISKPLPSLDSVNTPPVGPQGSNSHSAPGLPEEIRRNTVAMELVSSNRAFCSGRQQDRKSFAELQAEIGSHISAISRLFVNVNGVEEWQDGINPKAAAALVSAKKAMCAISMLHFLPPSNRLKQKILGAEPSKSAGIVRSGGSTRSRDTEADDDLWAENVLASSKQSRQRINARSNAKNPFKFVYENLNRTLLRLLAETLRVNPDNVVENDAVASEVDYVFATWRRPMLLLDYHRLHSSAPPVQQLYRRFLKALIGISSETVDDIRFKDPGNTAHFSRFPSKLVGEWMEGRTSRGDILPGYSDAQTLFMIGEDSSTCMMIRPRQKGTNRGLLSFLLHGNVRVLGRKDPSGRLVERAVVHLAVDETTQRPVLYVETPFAVGGTVGSGAAVVEVYDQAAELGKMLSLPVIYAAAPDPRSYAMSEYELQAIGHFSSERDTAQDDWDDEDIDEDDANEEPRTMNEHNAVVPPVSPDMLVNITDYTILSPFVWVDGIRYPSWGSFFPGHSPLLSKRSTHDSGVVIGVRMVGALEQIDNKRNWKCGPPTDDDTSAVWSKSHKEVEADHAFNDLLSTTVGPIMRRKAVRPGKNRGGTDPTSAPMSPQTKSAPSAINANSMMAKLIERNRALAERTKRVYKVTNKSPDEGKVLVDRQGEVKKEAKDRFADEKVPAVMEIFEDDVDDLFA